MSQAQVMTQAVSWIRPGSNHSNGKDLVKFALGLGKDGVKLPRSVGKFLVPIALSQESLKGFETTSGEVLPEVRNNGWVKL